MCATPVLAGRVASRAAGRMASALDAARPWIGETQPRGRAPRLAEARARAVEAALCARALDAIAQNDLASPSDAGAAIDQAIAVMAHRRGDRSAWRRRRAALPRVHALRRLSCSSPASTPRRRSRRRGRSPSTRAPCRGAPSPSRTRRRGPPWRPALPRGSGPSRAAGTAWRSLFATTARGSRPSTSRVSSIPSSRRGGRRGIRAALWAWGSPSWPTPWRATAGACAWTRAPGQGTAFVLELPAAGTPSRRTSAPKR
jgi:hypothetical protein